MDITSKSGGVIISIIGALLISLNGSFMNIDLCGLGIVLVLIGVVVFLSQK